MESLRNLGARTDGREYRRRDLPEQRQQQQQQQRAARPVGFSSFAASVRKSGSRTSDAGAEYADASAAYVNRAPISASDMASAPGATPPRHLHFAIGSATNQFATAFDLRRLDVRTGAMSLLVDASYGDLHLPVGATTRYGRQPTVCLSRKYSSLDPTLSRIYAADADRYAPPAAPPGDLVAGGLRGPTAAAKTSPVGAVHFGSVMRVNSAAAPAKLPRNESLVHQNRPLPNLPAAPARLIDFKLLQTVPF